MRPCSRLVAVAFVSMFLSMGTLSAADPLKAADLRQELLERMQEDQAARNAVLPLIQSGQFGEWDTLPATAVPEAIQTLKRIDCQNTARLKVIIEEHGWPGHSLVGKDGSHAAWLLVQHADHDREFQRRCLKLLKTAVEKQEAAGMDLAYLTDRVRIADKAKQVYGTQLQQVGNKLIPYPIEDEALVDSRRKAIGLESLAEYIKSAESAYSVKSDSQP